MTLSKPLWQRLGETLNVPRLYLDELTSAAAEQQAHSRLIETRRGVVEYALGGAPDASEAVLISHQSMGGYDQCLVIGRRFPGRRVIAVSRAGYLRTPTLAGLTPDEMADTFAALLDALSIDRVVMAGYSAGAMAAISFALRHSDRCRRLILGCPVMGVLNRLVMDVLAPIALANRSDFLNWVLSRITATALPLLERDPETLAILRAFQQTNPASARQAGYALDIAQIRTFDPPLERIPIPTLIIAGAFDPLIPIQQTRRAAARISGAHLLVIPRGSHDCAVRHPAQIMPIMNDFLGGL